MKFENLIIMITIFTLNASISLALESNMTDSSILNLSILKNDSASIENQNISRFYSDRSSFETNLLYHVPAPQSYRNELPPSGAKEITYDSGNLKLKAWLSDKPADGNKHPAVVYAHGGFAFGGSEWGDTQEFINKGFVLMIPTLRGENGNPGSFEFFYGEVDDLIAAADYLANVSYVDKDRIFLCGHSVGGTLSMLVSMMPSKYRAISSFSGSPDQGIFFKYDGTIKPFDSRNIKEIELRSPIIYSDSVIKPLFLFAGDQESFFLDTSKDFVKKTKENGRTCELIAVKGDHFSAVPEEINLSIARYKKIEDYEAMQLNRSLAYPSYKKGLDLYSTNKYQDAINCYNRAIEIDPRYAEAFRDKGAALGELGLYAEAIKALDKALEIDPESPESWRYKGVALIKLSRNEDALKCLEKATEMDSQYAEAWFDRGNALMNLGKYAEANIAYETATKLNPQHAESWYGKGLALYNLARYSEAIKCYDKAININPLYAMAWNNKGSALGSLGRYHESIKCFEKAIELDNKLALAWENKGVALKLLGKTAESNAALAKAKELEDTV